MSQYGKSIAQYQLLMEIEVKKHCHTFVWLSLQCRGGCLIWASKRYKLAIVYPTGHVWLELEWTTRVGGGEGREVNFTPPPPPPINLLILIVDRPSGTNLFPSSAFRFH